MTDDRIAALERELAKAQAEADRWRSDYRALQALHSATAASLLGSDYELTQAKAELADARVETERLQRKTENQAERIRYLEGATNHATGTPLTQALNELAAQREQVAQWMLANGFATGHGDTIADLLQELTWQVAALHAECERYKNVLSAIVADTVFDKQGAAYYKRLLSVWKDWCSAVLDYAARKAQP